MFAPDGGAFRDFLAYPPPRALGQRPQRPGNGQPEQRQAAAAMKTALAPECEASQPPSAPPVNRPAAWAVL